MRRAAAEAAGRHYRILRSWGQGTHRAANGFTVVELLVAIGLFSVAVAIAAGGLITAMRAERQVVGLIAANSNVSLVLEQVARELRTGFDFCVNGLSCPLEAGGMTAELSFRNARGEVVTYRREGEAVVRGVDGTFSVLTAGNVSVRHLMFRIAGYVPGVDLQPRITITIGVGTTERGAAGTTVTLQTTVSSRQPAS